MQHKKIPARFFVTLGVFTVVFLCVAALAINIRTRNLKSMKRRFDTTLSMTNNAFSSLDMDLDETSGTMIYYFSYRKEKNGFMDSCINFCNVLCDNSDSYKDDSNRYILCFKRGIQYFRFINEKKCADTNVFMEDYSVLEDFEKISCLQINARYFTNEQRQHLIDISSDYSFEMVIR